MATATVRHHLNALSNLYRRAMEDEPVLPGYNPVAALMEKPGRSEDEARWLEVPDAALLLAAAERLPRVATPLTAGLSRFGRTPGADSRPGPPTGSSLSGRS
jgi:hypothetical protein